MTMILGLLSSCASDARPGMAALEGADDVDVTPTSAVRPSEEELAARTALDDLVAVRAASLDADELALGLPIRRRAGGGVRSVLGPGFRVTASALGMRPTSEVRAVADAFVRRYAPLWNVTPQEFVQARVSIDHHTSPMGADADRVVYAQMHGGYPVAGAEIGIIVDDETRDVLGAVGSFVPFARAVPEADPQVDEATALTATGGETAEATYWSGLLDNTDAAPRLAWNVDDGAEQIFVDAQDGRELGRLPRGSYFLRRALADVHTLSTYRADTCLRWQTAGTGWPSSLTGCSAPACVACVTDPTACARCMCAFTPSDPPTCASVISQYDDLGTACTAPGCDARAVTLWNDAGTAYNYWSSSFGRDGWDGAGGWLMLRANVSAAAEPDWVGNARPRYVGSGTYRFIQVSVLNTALAFVDGHELGHALQYGTYGYNGGIQGFYNQTTDAMESHADAHASRFTGSSPALEYTCAASDHVHYQQYLSAIPDANQYNRLIGNCHSWLLTRTGSATTYHGVSVSPVALSNFDQVWFRALDLYFTRGDDYFDWWNQLIVSAGDLYGTSSATYLAFVAARDAIGGWTPNAVVTTSTGGVLGGIFSASDRIGAVGTTGSSSRTPCVFYRQAATDIYYSCRESTGWRNPVQLNSATDPAASDATATFRYESGRNMVYVLWTGTDHLIHYRTLDTTTYTVGAAMNLGSGFESVGSVAAAPLYESGSQDRLMVVYHPRYFPSYFYSTWIGNTGTYTDLGPSFDSTVAPALVGFPYFDRVYFVRPSSSGTHEILYESYTYNPTTMTGTWTNTPLSITALYASDTSMPAGVVASDQPVALAQFQRGSTPRLRMAFITTTGTIGGLRELWYATLRQSATTPGTLVIDASSPGRAVPLAPASGANMMTGPGGLTADGAGTSLWNFWGITKLSAWQSFAD